MTTVPAHADAEQRDEEADQTRHCRDRDRADREPGNDAQHAAADDRGLLSAYLVWAECGEGECVDEVHGARLYQVVIVGSAARPARRG